MDTVEIEVSGVRFYYRRMDAFEALEALGDLQKEVLPSLGGLLTLIGDTDDDESAAALSTSLERFSANLSGKQLRYWVDRLLSKDRVSVDIAGETKRLDVATRGQAFDSFTDIIELLTKVIKLEFADPLVSWASRAGLAQKFQGALSDATARK